MIIQKPSHCTHIPIWQPKYDTESGDWEVWILQRKVAYSSPVMIIEFTKAKHLMGQRFCIRRQDVEKCPIGSNGCAPVYKVPFNKLESYDTSQEVVDLANNLFED